MNTTPNPALQTSLCGVPLRNPILAASGTFGYGVEFEQILNLELIGGIIVKGLSRTPIDGNPPPRIWEAEAGMINSIGLQNIGVEAFVQQKLPLVVQAANEALVAESGTVKADRRFCEDVRADPDRAVAPPRPAQAFASAVGQGS